MDFISLLTGGSDNLYKYLFLGGLGLIILSLFYPVNKKYEYTYQKDSYNNEVKLLNHQISKLDETTTAFKKQAKQIIDDLEHMKKTGSNASKRKSALKDSFNKQYTTIKAYRDTIEEKKLAIEYNKVRVDTLNRHIGEFTKYEKIFFWVGILSAIAGIIGWFIRMQEESKKARNP
jgi:hypothetical protein